MLSSDYATRHARSSHAIQCAFEQEEEKMRSPRAEFSSAQARSTRPRFAFTVGVGRDDTLEYCQTDDKQRRAPLLTAARDVLKPAAPNAETERKQQSAFTTARRR